MSGFAPFLRKELAETLHTWRLWVLPGFVLFSAITAPILTYLTPLLIKRFGSGAQGIVITVGTPTATDAYISYLGNLGQLVALALVIAYGGIVSGELRGGQGALALAKPLSRTAYVLAKWLSQLLVLLAAAGLGAGVCVAVTTALFGAGPVWQTAAGTALWTAFAAVLLGAMVLISAFMSSPIAASGVGVAVYAALAILGQFSGLSRATPAGLLAAGTALLHGQTVYWVLPLTTALAAMALCLAVAVWRFSRREI